MAPAAFALEPRRPTLRLSTNRPRASKIPGHRNRGIQRRSTKHHRRKNGDVHFDCSHRECRNANGKLADELGGNRLRLRKQWMASSLPDRCKRREAEERAYDWRVGGAWPGTH